MKTILIVAILFLSCHSKNEKIKEQSVSSKTLQIKDTTKTMRSMSGLTTALSTQYTVTQFQTLINSLNLNYFTYKTPYADAVTKWNDLGFALTDISVVWQPTSQRGFMTYYLTSVNASNAVTSIDLTNNITGFTNPSGTNPTKNEVMVDIYSNDFDQFVAWQKELKTLPFILSSNEFPIEYTYSFQPPIAYWTYYTIKISTMYGKTVTPPTTTITTNKPLKYRLTLRLATFI